MIRLVFSSLVLAALVVFGALWSLFAMLRLPSDRTLSRIVLGALIGLAFSLLAFAGFFLLEVVHDPHPWTRAQEAATESTPGARAESLRSPPALALEERPTRTPGPPLAAVPDDGSVAPLESGGPTLLELVARRGLADLAPGYTPTLEGLEDLTLARWSQPEFRELTTEDATRLLPIEWPDYGAKLPTQVDAIVGGYPTRADLEEGMRSPEVRERLLVAQLRELELVLLDGTPLERRSLRFARVLEAAERARAEASAELFACLDRETAYGSWALLARLYDAWAR